MVGILNQGDNYAATNHKPTDQSTTVDRPDSEFVTA